MAKTHVLIASLILFTACAKNHQAELTEIRAELEAERQLLRETRTELQAVIEKLQPLVALAEMSIGALETGGAATPPEPSMDPELAEELSKGITRTSENHFKITRALVDKMMSNPNLLSRQARIVPSIKDGKPNGFKLYAIRPGSIYSKLGLENGDTLHKINGHELSSPDKALEAYTAIEDASKFEIDLSRRGAGIRLVIEIE